MMTVSKQAQRLINRYLRRVERALRHLDSQERREILSGLRTHINEGLAERGSSPSGTDDVRAVLASMDAPQGFRVEDDVEASMRTGRSRTLGRIGFYFLVAALGMSGLALLLGAVVTDALLRGGLILGGVLAVCALGFGIAGWRDPFGKAAVIGAVLALACAMVLIPTSQTSTGPSQPIVEAHSGPPEQ